MIIGVVGGIGSGKSTAARCFEKLGALVIDSDTIGRQALQAPDIKASLVEAFGDGILAPDGTIDRSALADIVFRAPEHRRVLEGIVHPYIHRHRAKTIDGAQRDGIRCVIIDAPLLFESGIDNECDTTIFIDCPQAIRLQRVMTHRGWGPDELARREAAQWPLEQKKALCDHIIVNDSDEEELCSHIADRYATLTQDRAG